jgi:protein required for attachment to host cells
MEPMWIVVADEGRARFLSCPAPGRELTEMDELTDAGAHADNADLRRDAYGRRGPSVTSSAGEDKLDHEAELFARRVAERLAEGHRQHRYGELRIAAAPRFLGRLRKALDPEVSKSVVDEIDKDLLQLDRRELAHKLFPPPQGNG